MDLQEVRSRIVAVNSDETVINRQEFELFCERVIAELPRNEDTFGERIWAYEQLISLKTEEGLPVRAMRLFRKYIGDCAPVCDDPYDQSYCAGLQITGTSLTPLRRRERFYSLVQLLRKALTLDGLIAECGCYRGLSSYLLCNTMKQADGNFGGRGFRIFDSFAGLSAPQAEDQGETRGPESERVIKMTRAGKFAASLDSVRTALVSFPEIEYYPGWIPQAFPDEPNARYRFVHIDVDLFQPTLDSIEYFYPRLVPGGMLVSDDYNWPGARKAIEKFCAGTRATFEVTPYTQAYIVRHA